MKNWGRREAPVTCFVPVNEQTRGFVLALKVVRRLGCYRNCLPENRHGSGPSKDTYFFLASDL